MMDTIVEKMKQKREITEQLKADDFVVMEQEMNNIRNTAKSLCFWKWCTHELSKYLSGATAPKTATFQIRIHPAFKEKLREIHG